MREHARQFKCVAITAVAMVALTITSGAATADPAPERSVLVRLIHELEALETLIREAEAGAISTQRVRFQYSWLRADLERIKAGIREYLDVAPTTPRTLPPLAGDYIR